MKVSTGILLVDIVLMLSIISILLPLFAYCIILVLTIYTKIKHKIIVARMNKGKL